MMGTDINTLQELIEKLEKMRDENKAQEVENTTSTTTEME